MGKLTDVETKYNFYFSKVCRELYCLKSAPPPLVPHPYPLIVRITAISQPNFHNFLVIKTILFNFLHFLSCPLIKFHLLIQWKSYFIKL